MSFGVYQYCKNFVTVCFVCLYLKKILGMQGDACFMKISYFNWKVNEKRDRNNMVLLEYVFLNTLFLKVKKQRRLLSQKKK